MPHRHAPDPFSAPAVSGSPVRAAPVPPLARTHSSQNESGPERPIYEADRFNRPSFARYSEKISEDRKAAKPKERDRRKRKHRSVSDRQHTAFPHRSQRNRKEKGTKRINRGNENGRSPPAIDGSTQFPEPSTARPADSVLRRTTFRPVHSKDDCPDERPALRHRTRSGTESSARISERRKKHEPACPYDRIGDRQQQRIEKTYGETVLSRSTRTSSSSGPQPGPCIFRHRAFRIGGNQAFASLRPRR